MLYHRPPGSENRLQNTCYRAFKIYKVLIFQSQRPVGGYTSSQSGQYIEYLSIFKTKARLQGFIVYLVAFQQDIMYPPFYL